MTPIREAFVLPGIFLTVALLGGLRIASLSRDVRLMAPSLMAMVLAMLLVGCLVRSRALAPERLMNSGRTALENLSGLVVLITLFIASAQVFNLVTPDTGLLFLLFSWFFFVQLLTTLAAVRERAPFLQALAVLLGSAFLIRFIGLEALYSPDSGTLQRVLTAMMQGVTLGALEYAPHAPITGYAAFFTLALFLVGVVLLPGAAAGATGLPMLRDADRELLPPAPRSTVLLLLFVAATQPACSGPAQAADAAVSPAAAAARNSAFAAASVWQEPRVPVSRAQLGENPSGGWKPTDVVGCKFVFETVGGTTPKFNCELADGEVVKVKYGRTNDEMYTEVAASRLVSALGFGSDRMFVIRSVRCSGCPSYPFLALRCLRRSGFRAPCELAALPFRDNPEFDHAVVERRMAGAAIETYDGQGWAWFELDAINPARGGSSRDEVDALRLLAVILAHWDNKAANQRLMCLPGGERADGSCGRPFALMHDLGATFGPTKLDLHNWRRVRVWSDPRACTVSMRSLPYGGATFPDRQISEEGRLKLLALLEQLSAAQLEELFTTSGMTDFDALSVESRNPRAWVQAFRDKVQEVRGAGPCPTAREAGRRSER
jgi:hypothetical protein